MKEMKICVRSLSTGVEKDWITPLEALAFMEEQEQKDGSEEFIIVDYDAPFEISEYDSVADLADLMEEIEAYGGDLEIKGNFFELTDGSGIVEIY